MHVLAMPFDGGKFVSFDETTGTASPYLGDPHPKLHGNTHVVSSHRIALYVDAGRLLLQIDGTRWAIEDLELSYRHDVKGRRTIFSAKRGRETITIDYPAWWSELRDEPLPLPELDEENDYLAYVHSAWARESLRRELISAWQD